MDNIVAGRSFREEKLADKGWFTWALAGCVAAICLTAAAQSKNNFDLSHTTIPVQEIMQGGPPRDGIPAIDAPQFLPAAEASFLRADDVVIAVSLHGVARAYPTRILVWHEIVNDRIGDTAFVVTYCPLCGTAMVFDRTIGGTVRSFGVSGLLYQSDVLMYDRESDSLWSQLAMQGVSGAAAGTSLTWLPAEHLTWAAWLQRHPDGEVLSTDTGHRRDYADNPYTAYFASDALMFPVPQHRSDLSNKSWVVGVLIDGMAKAYPIDALPPAQTIRDTVGNTAVHVQYDAAARRAEVRDAHGTLLPAVQVFWFAWQAFYPHTAVWQE